MELRPVEHDDAPALAALHAEAFPGFFLSTLGEGFLKEFYSGFPDDETAVTVLAKEGERVLGCVVGSVEPAGFFRRLLKRRLWGFAIQSAKASLRRPSAIPRLVRGLTYRGDTPPEAPGALLSSICVAPSTRGTGVGASLTRRWMELVAHKGVKHAYLTTDADSNEAVNAFYSRLGWSLQDQYTTAQGRRMNLYAVDLSDRSPLPPTEPGATKP